MDTESETPPLSNENLYHIPVIGKTFKSEDEAYNFYNLFGRLNGFSIRRGSSTRRSGLDKIVTRRVLCCSKEGQYKKYPRGSPANRRLITRTNCNARLVYKLFPDNLYHVTELHETHNHDLALSSEVHHLRSQRSNGDDIYVKGGNSGLEQRTFHAFMREKLPEENLVHLMDKRLMEEGKVKELEANSLVHAPEGAPTNGSLLPEGTSYGGGLLPEGTILA
ncbi:hypothetical protein GIB67_010957 [Kingdonia uniflora]|uniref:FAR1 domain-containing protein n=1 Tax=Kingdonia uniflora TaxID=39325 RepID=A0A7J7N821_9MAGN|nr:hypothetical protein GIB67_024467 [Kingdonia uniflora]KAF6163038.1 hypothetical protein GIB67_010957 [Kingdonia uniflora]